MDVNTGHLKLFGFDEETPDNYTPVPSELEHAARRKLAGATEATVSLTSGGKLSRWAASERKRRRRKGQRSYKDYCR